MTYRVVVTPGAERDLDDIFRFIARDNPGAARMRPKLPLGA